MGNIIIDYHMLFILSKFEVKSLTASGGSQCVVGGQVWYSSPYSGTWYHGTTGSGEAAQYQVDQTHSHTHTHTS